MYVCVCGGGDLSSTQWNEYLIRYLGTWSVR